MERYASKLHFDYDARAQNEATLIGLMLKCPEHFSNLSLSGLKPEHFSHQFFGQVYGYALYNYREHKAIPTLESLKSAVPDMQKAKFETEIGALAESCTEPWENYELYVEKLLDAWKIQRFVEISSLTAQFAEDGKAVDEIEQRVRRHISDTTYDSNSFPKASGVPGLQATLDRVRGVKQGVIQPGQAVIPTGYEPLNQILNGGFRTGTLTYVVGSPGHGKSTVLQNLSLNTSLYSEMPTGFFSIEMALEQIQHRCLSALTVKMPGTPVEVPAVAFKNPHLLDSSLDARAQEAIDLLDGLLPLHNIDASGIRSDQLYAEIERLRDDHGVRIFFVDYFQIIHTERGRMPKDESEFAEVSETLRLAARNLNVAVVVGCQPNREVEKRSKDDQKPRLSDIRNTGKAEQDAEVVIGVYRDEMVNKVESTRPNEVNIEVLKNRDGGLGEFPLLFNKRCFCLSEVNRTRGPV